MKRSKAPRYVDAPNLSIPTRSACSALWERWRPANSPARLAFIELLDPILERRDAATDLVEASQHLFGKPPHAFLSSLLRFRQGPHPDSNLRHGGVGLFHFLGEPTHGCVRLTQPFRCLAQPFRQPGLSVREANHGALDTVESLCGLRMQ
jgi:hypothetical protein